MASIKELETRKLTIQGKRLLHEWKELEKLCENHNRISCIIRKRNVEDLPVVYEIVYKVKSIVGVEDPEPVNVETEDGVRAIELRKPVYGDEHRMRVSLPNNYPSANGNPQFFFITDIWHPNVRYSGKKKGRVCTNEKDLGVTASLASRILRIGQYLQYQLYHAEDTAPYPEDKFVAEWILEEAEPMGWIDKSRDIYCDYHDLRKKSKKLSDNTGDKKPVIAPLPEKKKIVITKDDVKPAKTDESGRISLKI